MIQVTKRPWGELNGREIWLYDITGRDIAASVSNYGGVLQALRVRCATGEMPDVVLGYDSVDDYRRSDTFFGAMIGPIADRLSLGRCILGGKTVQMPLNAGPDSMHCGDLGFHRIEWDTEPLPDGVRLRHMFAAEELGFPGALEVVMAYRVSAPATLRLEYAARSTGEAAVSFTNHSYFNLSGAARDCMDHRLCVRARRYAETERMIEPICTGATPSVEGTPMDLRGGARVGDRVGRGDFREIAAAGGIDHYFPVEGGGFREAASLYCPDTGITMRCLTDAPGLLVYTGNGLDAEPGKGGRVYGRHWGVCLETERFPNAVNFPDRRSGVLLAPGEWYRSATEFVFG